MTEIKAETQGILWLGEQENQVAIVHGKKTAVALRGAALRGWTEGVSNQKICRKDNNSVNRRGKTGSCVSTLVEQRLGGSGELQDGDGAGVGHGKKKTDHGDGRRP